MGCWLTLSGRAVNDRDFGVRRPAVALSQQSSRLSNAVTKRRQASHSKGGVVLTACHYEFEI